MEATTYHKKSDEKTQTYPYPLICFRSSLQVLMAHCARHPSPHDALSTAHAGTVLIYRSALRSLRAVAVSKAHLHFYTLPDLRCFIRFSSAPAPVPANRGECHLLPDSRLKASKIRLQKSVSMSQKKNEGSASSFFFFLRNSQKEHCS